jgi:hypothetical protein
MPAHTLPRPVYRCQCGDHAWTVLTRGYITMVSPEDAHFLEARRWCVTKGTANKTFYVVSRIDYVLTRLHRLILGLKSDIEGDHKFGNGLDNRRKHLRPATRDENMRNAPSHTGSTSKFRGVSWAADQGKWKVQIHVDKKQMCLGSFSIEVDAALAYDAAAMKYFGEFARLNFPPHEASHAEASQESPSSP